MPLPSSINRRAFLQRAAQLTGLGVAAPLGLNLAAMGEAAAQTSNDYKALVCVFLNGGNDHASTVVPYDPLSHSRYSAIRTTAGMVPSREALAATTLKSQTLLPEGQQYAFHPAMSGLADLFNAGTLAVQFNTGPLVVPLTRTQFHSGDRRLYPLPPKLFSHNDQQSVWQSSSPEGSTQGWGGKIGDLALSNNGNALFTCISVTGNAVFLSGQTALQYQCSTAGPVPVQALSDSFFWLPEQKAAFSQLLQQSSTHALEDAYTQITKRSLQAYEQVAHAVAGVQLPEIFPIGNPLADQLKMVAQLIGARQSLGNKRQVFMVSLGGFDVHDNLMSRQAVLLRQLSEAMTAFYTATVALGVATQITTFTASDFGRTLTSNGDGSDHGWGAHHLMMGGAVLGQRFYGTPAPLGITDTGSADDQWHVGQGRLLPTCSVDQYAATLARWFGVQTDQLSAILPNLHHFDVRVAGIDFPRNLGFLA